MRNNERIHLLQGQLNRLKNKFSIGMTDSSKALETNVSAIKAQLVGFDKKTLENFDEVKKSIRKNHIDA
jgi:hypothetical protein